MEIKLPGPKPLGDDIDMGFSRLKILQEDDSIDEKSGSESDNVDTISFAQNFLEVGEPIEQIITTHRK